MYESAILMLLIFLVVALPPTVIVKSDAVTLASTIATVINSNSWSGTPETISIGTVFGKNNLSDFDALNIPDGSYDWAWARQVASVDGYTSQTLDAEVQNMMSNIAMTGYLPITYPLREAWLADDRYLIPCYDLASQWGLSSKWNKASALAELQSNLARAPLLGFSSGVGWYYASRYYDEWIQDLDIMSKMGDTASAATLWAGVNSSPPDAKYPQSWGNWNGTDYVYRPDEPSILECEVGFFAAVVGNYEATVGSIPNFDRVSTDLYNKLLVNGWSSPLWVAPSAMQHATTDPELRLQNTLGGIEALHMYYTVSGSAYKSAFISLLAGGTPAWQQLSNGVFFQGGYSDPASNAMKAALLFLYGIIPDSGSLAIPCNEWKYQDFATMLPSTLFRFDYDTQRIRIPVWAGTIKFIFGTSTSSHDFPYDGVYDVTFSPDWNTLTGATFVSSLNSQFHYINPPSHGACSKEIVGQGYPVEVDVTIANSNNSAETAQVGVYANQTSIFDGTVSFANESSTTYTLTCDTTGLTEGNYTIQIHSTPAVSNNDTANNTFNIGWIIVTVPGDVDGNYKVQRADLVILAKAYGSKQGDPNWNPNADIDDNGTDGLTDLVILALHYGQHYP